MNARLTPDAIEILGHIHMGMAVDTERGLLVPVIRDADKRACASSASSSAPWWSGRRQQPFAA